MELEMNMDVATNSNNLLDVAKIICCHFIKLNAANYKTQSSNISSSTVPQPFFVITHSNSTADAIT